MRENHKILNIYIYIYCWPGPGPPLLGWTRRSPAPISFTSPTKTCTMHILHCEGRNESKRKRGGGFTQRSETQPQSLVMASGGGGSMRRSVFFPPLFFLFFSTLFFSFSSSLFSLFCSSVLSLLFFHIFLLCFSFCLSPSLFFYCSFSSLSSRPLSPFSLVFIGKTREKRRPTTPAQSMAQGQGGRGGPFAAAPTPPEGHLSSLFSNTWKALGKQGSLVGIFLKEKAVKNRGITIFFFPCFAHSGKEEDPRCCSKRHRFGLFFIVMNSG